ncbi:MAG: hypothetical protein K9G44_06620, partial [Melioribacteraceae bacterium]|nr:hypothetical protein [Melioribacteraceae bacterium]
IGWLIVTVYLIFLFNNGKPYYMGVLFPVIFAGGAVLLGKIIDHFAKNWLKPVVIILMIPSFIFVTPFAMPILEVHDFIKFQEFTGIKPESGERSETGVLPQFYADRFGWEDMVEEVARIYNSLPEEEKSKTVIFGQNYGQAGAVEYYSDKYNLPDVISNHNNYWIWSKERNIDAEVYIVIDSNFEDNSKFFEEVEFGGSHFNEFGKPSENVDIFICRKPKHKFSDFWKNFKDFI